MIFLSLYIGSDTILDTNLQMVSIFDHHHSRMFDQNLCVIDLMIRIADFDISPFLYGSEP